MSASEKRQGAAQPEDLGRFFVERARAGDLEGLVALYEPNAVLAVPPDQVVTGHDAIRGVYKAMLASGRTFTPGNQRPALRCGDLALTSTRRADGGDTAEVARRQPDGSWLWAIDQPKIGG